MVCLFAFRLETPSQSIAQHTTNTRNTHNKHTQAFTPVITMVCLFAFRLETPSQSMILSVLFIAVGTALAAYGEVAFDTGAAASLSHVCTCVGGIGVCGSLIHVQGRRHSVGGIWGGGI